MEQIRPDLENLYEKFKVVLYQVVHYQDEFQRNCFPKSEIEKNIKSCINDALKNIVADVYQAAEIINEVLSSESDTEATEVLRHLTSEIIPAEGNH